MSEGATRVGAFINRKLDEYGLTPTDFRIYCHIARRGDCYASARTIGTVCRLHRNTVFRGLKLLLAQKLIESEQQPGRPTCYRVTKISEWLPPLNPYQSNRRVGRPTRTKVIETPVPLKVPGVSQGNRWDPYQSNRHKGNPISSSQEGNPNKGEARPAAGGVPFSEETPPKHEFFDHFGNEIPTRLRTQNFLAALMEWHEYKKQRGESYKSIGAKGFLAKCERLLEQGDVNFVIGCIHDSIGCNWAGVFASKNTPQNRSYPPPQPSFKEHDGRNF